MTGPTNNDPTPPASGSSPDAGTPEERPAEPSGSGQPQDQPPAESGAAQTGQPAPPTQQSPPAGEQPPAESGAQWSTQQMPLSQQYGTGAQPPAQSGSQWPTQQLPAQAEGPSYGQPEQSGEFGSQPYGQYGSAQPPQQYADGPGAPWPGNTDGPPTGGLPPKKSNKKLLAIIAAVVAVVLVGGGLYFFLSGEDITYQGRDIVEAEKVLSSAEATVDGIVEQRNGATNDETSCYFVVKNADTTDIEDGLVCGPVLFVDGDDTQPYLTLPLQASSGDGDASLTVAAEPDSPEPAELADPDLLRRPDGGTPPDGNGGLAVPEPPRAEAGIFAVVSSDGIELDSAPATARVGSPTMSISLTGIGEVERYGQGDEARRPAESEKFVAFEIVGGPGEVGPAGGFSLAVQAGDADPVPLPDDADLSGGPVALAISVPQDAEDVSLVVTEGSLVQRLSLTTGEPDPANIAVWQREFRSQPLAFSQPLTVRASKPGFVAEDFPCILSVASVDLTYFSGPNGDRAPSATSQAFLDLDNVLNCEGQPGQFDSVFWSLTLPDGTVLPAIDLNDDPTQIEIAFDVAASFTEGTLTFGGVGPAPDGVTFDTLGVFLPIPVSIPAG